MDWIDGVGARPASRSASRWPSASTGDELSIDFTGTAPQVQASVNCPVGMIYAACYCAIRGIAEREIPNCEGYMRPIAIHAPEGTIVNPVLPAACGARGVVGYRVYDALMGALAQIAPDRVVAAGEGGPTLIAIGGYENGRPFVTTEVIVGTWGARAGKDGLEGVSNPLANLSNQPVELVEADLPLEVVRYELVPDSGGAGRFRGGLAFLREFRLRAESAVLTIRSDRRAPPALRPLRRRPGGAFEQHAPLRRLGGGASRHADGGDRLRQGDVYRHVSAGGGGVGIAVRARPGAGARGRARRQGDRRGGAPALRRRRCRPTRPAVDEAAHP